MVNRIPFIIINNSLLLIMAQDPNGDDQKDYEYENTSRNDYQNELVVLKGKIRSFVKQTSYDINSEHIYCDKIKKFAEKVDRYRHSYSTNDQIDIADCNNFLKEGVEKLLLNNSLIREIAKNALPFPHDSYQN